MNTQFVLGFARAKHIAERAGDFWSKSVLIILKIKAPFLVRLDDFLRFSIYWVFGSLQTTLL